MTHTALDWTESIGATYPRALITVDAGDAVAVRDAERGAVYGVQRAPRMGFDPEGDGEVALIVADVTPAVRLKLESTDTPADAGEVIRVEPDESTGGRLIVNGRLAVRLPADGWVEQPFPGPILGMQRAGGEWFGRMTLVDAPWRGYVATTIESVGPAFVQWKTEYHWGSDGGHRFRARWAAGSDTLRIEEEAFEDSDAAIEWFPFGEKPADAWCGGGGEHTRPMERLTYDALPEARRERGRRVIDYLSHIGYFNQWNLAWVGFTPAGGDSPDDTFVGAFSGWASRWRRRGRVRMAAVADDEAGDLLRMPVREGRRIWGLVITTREAAAADDQDRRTLLNRRKTQCSDLAPDKVRHWELNAPDAPRRPRLVSDDDLRGVADRLAGEQRIAQALRDVLANGEPAHRTHFPAALWAGDEPAMQAAVPGLRRFADRVLQRAADGGYECLVIFDGRTAKALAHPLDALWALGLIEPDDYRYVSRAMLLLGYIFADPDYCFYEDFQPHLADPAEGIAEAMKDDMGDAPNPPNFASEFFTTTGVVAELYPDHPMHATWRQWAMDRLDDFFNVFFSDDGTYCESINYHAHGFNEILCHIYALWRNGVRDYFAEPTTRGTYEHFLQLQTPPIRQPLPEPSGAADARTIRADGLIVPRCVLPNDGNSGNHGSEMDHKGELALGAWVYRETDRELAGRLAAAWRRSGRVIVDHEHPLLTLLTIDPSIEPVELAPASAWRRWLGVVSKAEQAGGTPVWCLFRAGKATHHMDFDQGNVHLMLGDRVLLGDHGYHTHDSDGASIAAAATWLHNTLTYGEDRNLSSGYTGLERAPEPAAAHAGDEFDWCVHRIVNDNFRDLERLSYRDMIPAPLTVHVRHYLFVKPDYIVLWDTFETAHGPSTYWLHPWQPMEQVDAGRFRAGQVGEPHLAVEMLAPAEPRVVENARRGPLWSFAVTAPAGEPYLTLLVPQVNDREVRGGFDPSTRTLTVTGADIDDRIVLPPAGSADDLPRIERR